VSSKSFDKIYADLRFLGRRVSPRGSEVLELCDYQYILDPFVRFANYPSRKLSLDYVREELKWYFKGDKRDLSICQHAKIWEKCVDADGVIESNYGAYLIAGGGIGYTVECLVVDRDSRRAVVPILGMQHLDSEAPDVPCTLTWGLRIRNNKLYCSVHMRSQDAIFGLGNDVPFFSICQELALRYLNATYDSLVMGPLTVTVDSLHVYSRHYSMLEQLLLETVEEVQLPLINHADAVAILHQLPLPPTDFARWLHETD
jgi:thymidylate synthase